MNKFGGAVLLGLFVTVSCEPTETQEQSCNFPHKGGGKLLDENQNYIKDSTLVWVDVAVNCFDFVNDPRGRVAVENWIKAIQKFNTAMENDNEKESFKLLDQINANIRNAAPFISNADLSKYMNQVNDEFGSIVDERDIQDVNEYSMYSYPLFIQYLGCQNDGSYQNDGMDGV